MNPSHPSRPAKVGQAVTLLYATLGIGFFRNILEVARRSQDTSAGFVMSVILFTLGVSWFFIYMIGKGKNWARITLLVLFVIGLPFALGPLLQSLTAAPVSGLLGIAQAGMQILALAFLFQKPSSDWFKEKKASGSA